MCRCWILMVALVLLLSACGDSNTSPTTTLTSQVISSATPSSQAGSPENPELVLEQVRQAIERDGQIFHSLITTIVTAGNAFPEREGQEAGLWTEEVWIVPDEQAVRKLFVRDSENIGDLADEALVLFVDGTLYLEDDGEIEAHEWQAFCPPGKTPQLIAFILDTTCRSFGPSTEMGQPVTTRVDSAAEFHDVPAVAIVYEQVLQPEGQPSPTPFSPAPPTPFPNINPQRMEARLYLDPETFLPLAWESMTWDHAGRLMGTGLASFESEFIPGSELDPGFFDPEAFGYVAKDLLAPLNDPNLDVIVYWVGETFEPDNDLPPMEVNDVLGLTPPGGGPGHQAMIEYATVDRSSPAFGFRLQIWTPAGWKSRGSQIGSDIWQHPCVEIQTLPVEGGTATIYQSYEPNLDGLMPGSPGDCPDRAHDRFMTIIDYGDTLVTINAPLANMLGPRGNENAIDPYDSLNGMLAIIEGLRPR